jgi:hypothetical protein
VAGIEEEAIPLVDAVEGEIVEVEDEK